MGQGCAISGRQFSHSAVLSVRQGMAGAAQRGQILGGVGPATGAGDDVVDFEVVVMVAARGLAAVAVTGQHEPPGFRGNGGAVGVARLTDLGVA
jgi:hypothetical protein